MLTVCQTRPLLWAPIAAALTMYMVIYLSGADHQAFLQLNHAAHRIPSPMWVNFTMPGDGAVTLALVLPTVRKSPSRFWAAVIGAVLVSLFVQIAKHLDPHPRTPAVLAPDLFFQYGPRLRAVSFPSGHAAAFFTLAGVWIMNRPLSRHICWALFAAASLVGMSRIAVGVHWPTDVLGGMVLGWLAAGMGTAVANRAGWDTNNAAGYAVSAVLMLVCAALLVSHHIGFPDALPMQRAIGLSCLLVGGWELFRLRSARRTP